MFYSIYKYRWLIFLDIIIKIMITIAALMDFKANQYKPAVAKMTLCIVYDYIYIGFVQLLRIM